MFIFGTKVPNFYVYITCLFFPETTPELFAVQGCAFVYPLPDNHEFRPSDWNYSWIVTHHFLFQIFNVKKSPNLKFLKMVVNANIVKRSVVHIDALPSLPFVLFGGIIFYTRSMEPAHFKWESSAKLEYLYLKLFIMTLPDSKSFGGTWIFQ